MMMLTIGTGVGGGIVVNNELYRGAFGIAAEFGHLRVVPEGHLCGCGARGCFEQYASGSALRRHAREAISASPDLARNLLARGDGTIDGLTGQAITDAAREGDAVALAAFQTTAQYLGAGIASLAVLLDPSCVVIGGGVSAAGDLLLAPMRKAYLNTLPASDFRPHLKFAVAEFVNDAGVVGAADLARRESSKQ
jgi:glucokinase